MIIGTSHSLKKVGNFQFEINDSSVIQTSPKLKILGVIVDPVLSWDAHISHVAKKCNIILISLYRFRHYFTKDTLKIIIQAYVFPHITYCLCVWGGATQGRLHKIQKLVNFAARIVTGYKKHQHITPALNSLKWPWIESLVAHRDLIKVFKTLRYDNSPVAIRRLFTQRSAVSVRETRASEKGDLQVSRCNRSASQRVFSHRAALAWSALPPTVRDKRSLAAFKTALQNM